MIVFFGSPFAMGYARSCEVRGLEVTRQTGQLAALSFASFVAVVAASHIVEVHVVVQLKFPLALVAGVALLAVAASGQFKGGVGPQVAV